MLKAIPIATSLLAVAAAPAQYSPPVLDPNLNTASSEFDPCPTFTGLKLYFSSNRNGGNWELFYATRPAPYAAFANATHLAELTSTGTDYGPCIRIDDCEILWASTRPGGGGGTDIWRATRASPAVAFGTPTPVTEVNTTGSESGPALTADGLTLFFGRNSDIWTAVRPSWTAPFGTPVPVAELNTSGNEREPHVTGDGLTIFWTAPTTGNDTWMAMRPARNAPFANLTNLTAVNSTTADTAPAVAMFADELFFVSSRAGGVGPYDIYSSRFTGLLGNGVAGPSSSMTLRYSDPGSVAFNYLGAAALGTTPGIRFDTRTFPLNADALLGVTIGGLPPVMTGFVGVLDANGLGSGQITFPGLGALVGLRFYTAFVVIDPAAPSGLRTLSNAHEVLIQ
jgi:hypothetical protein